jgi:hypothetical protein
MGLEHGAFPIGGCPVVMALLRYGGDMNLHWVGGLAALDLLEKVLPHGHRCGDLGGRGFLLRGLVLPVTAPRPDRRPTVLPGHARPRAAAQDERQAGCGRRRDPTKDPSRQTPAARPGAVGARRRFILDRRPT